MLAARQFWVLISRSQSSKQQPSFRLKFLGILFQTKLLKSLNYVMNIWQAYIWTAVLTHCEDHSTHFMLIPQFIYMPFIYSLRKPFHMQDIRTQNWPATNISRLYSLVGRPTHRSVAEVMSSNPVAALTFVFVFFLFLFFLFCFGFFFLQAKKQLP